MRNALVALGLVMVGVVSNLAPNRPSGSIEQHTDSVAAKRPGGLSESISEDSPLGTLYSYDHPSADAPGGRAAVRGTFEVSLGNPAKKVFEARLNLPPAEQPSCEVDLLTRTPENEFVIATAPDPEKTHLTLMFDRHLEAILFAAEDAGYDLDRYWLPWRTEPSTSSAADPVTVDAASRSKYPGIAIFRDGDRKTLIVFLVGEMPTSGIDRVQFDRAACYVHAFESHRARFLGVLGPTLSGSFTSLNLAMKQNGLGDARVISGTTSDSRAINQFKQSHKSFYTTIHDDTEVQAAIGFQNKWAALAEESSVYGRETDQSHRCGSSGSEGKADSCLEIFFYPREISRLRNAYQEDPTLASTLKSSDIDAVRRQLSLPLGDLQIGKDTAPQFSGRQTPASQETVLFQIAQHLDQGRFKTVVPKATDVLDTLFLSRFMEQYTTDVRIATIDSDLLFVHGTDSLDYTGLLTIGTFPLLEPLRRTGRNTGWLARSDDAAGAFHAMADLVCGCDEGASSKQPIWLTVVGRGAYLPIAVLKAGSDSHLPLPPAPSRLWDTVAYSSYAFALLFALIYGRTRWPGTPLKRWRADFHPEPEDAGGDLGARGRLWYFRLTALLLFSSVCLIGLGPAFLAFGPSGRNSPDWRPTGLAAEVVAIVLIGVIMHTAWRQPRRRMALGLGAILIWMGAWSWPAWNRPSEYQGYFAAIRSVDLSSGVAPILPILLLAVALGWWAWISLQRMIIASERMPGCPYLSANINHAWSEQEFVRFAHPMPINGWVEAGAALAAVAVTAIPAWVWVFSLEGRLYDSLLIALLSLVGALLVGTATQFARMWGRVRGMLEVLNLHPIRDAFSALPPVAAWAPLWQGTARKKNYILRQRTLECLERLRNVDPWYYGSLGDDFEALRTAMSQLSKHIADETREPTYITRDFDDLANRVAKQVQQRLTDSFWKRGASETLDALQLENPPDRAELLAAEFIALRFVAFIRYLMLQLRNLLSFMTVGFMLVTVALNSYAFQGANYLRWWITVMFVTLGAIVVRVFVQMDVDATLSRLTNTKAGKLEPEFFLKIASVGALPLVTVVASHFPTVGRFLFSWIHPALSAIQ